MDSTRTPAVAQRLHYLKCTQCRKDKKKCLPLSRSWPRQKCDRCAKYHYACSASITAKEERQLEHNTSRDLLPSGVSEYRSNIPSAIHELQPLKTRLGKINDGLLSRPKCAIYFSFLIKTSWLYFGCSQPQELDLGGIFAFGISFSANLVYYAFEYRTFLIGIGQKYAKILEEGIAGGMSEDESKTYASRTVIYEYGKEDSAPEKQREGIKIDGFVRKFDSVITIALRWKSLLDAVGVPEVLLIQYSKESSEYLEHAHDSPNILHFLDIWDTETGSTSENEWLHLLNKLLSPTLGFKETCLKLNGVADMIQRLKGLDKSEARTYLAEEIKRRVRSVLGDGRGLPEDSEGEEDEDFDEDDESMADVEENHAVETTTLDGSGNIGVSHT